MKLLYPARFQPQRGGGYTVTFPDFSEAVTEGDSLQQAKTHASEVLTLTLEARAEEGIAIPRPSPRKSGLRLVVPSVRVQAALLFRHIRKDKKLAEIAKALDTSWPAAARLEDPKHWPTLKQLERAAAAVGKRLVISYE
jgi:antitoxin HicB